ncbi:MAG: hypothetical protein SFX73_02315 [Kofleriaceae bacterium]|nr:hypothetical protein [Kofleriaceae bacterium]
MVRALIVSLLVLSAVSGCAPRTRAQITMALGATATLVGAALVADVSANPTSCASDDAMGLDGLVNAAGCAGYDAARAMPGALLASTGAAALVTGIIAYALAPSAPRHERQAPVRFLRGERWTRLRDARERGRSGR